MRCPKRTSPGELETSSEHVTGPNPRALVTEFVRGLCAALPAPIANVVGGGGHVADHDALRRVTAEVWSWRLGVVGTPTGGVHDDRTPSDRRPIYGDAPGIGWQGRRRRGGGPSV